MLACVFPGRTACSVVSDEHSDAAGGEVGHVRAGGLALGRRHGSAEHLLGRVAELGDQVIGRLRAVERCAVAIRKAVQPGDLLDQGNVRRRVVGVERGRVGGMAVANGQDVHQLPPNTYFAAMAAGFHSVGVVWGTVTVTGRAWTTQTGSPSRRCRSRTHSTSTG